MINENVQHQMDSYLLGTMPVSERQIFEKQLEENGDFRASFEEHRKVFITLRKEFIKNELRSIHTHTAIKKPVFNIRYVAGIAASLVLILFSWLYFRPSPNQQLYQTYFYTDAGLPVTMGLSQNKNFVEAMNDYKLGKYDIAKAEFQKLQQTNPTNDTLNFYIGMSLINQQKLEEATQNLILIDKNSTFYSDANYFLALIAVRNDAFQDAKEFLKESKNPKAANLLKEIEP